MERVEVEPYFAGLARVRAWVNLMTLEGSLIDSVKPEEPQLVKAVDKAIKTLQATPPLRPNANVRKLILVIGDGNDNDAQDEMGRVPPETRDEFRKLSRAARSAGIVIHTIAFSFLDNREP